MSKLHQSAALLALLPVLSSINTTQSMGDTLVSGDVSPTDLSANVVVGGASDGTVVIDDGSTVLTSPSGTGGPYVTLGPSAGSTGGITVTDPGSLWRVEGLAGDRAAFFTIGRNGVGVLDIENGGRVELDSLGADVDRTGLKPGPAGFVIGRSAGSDGTVKIIGPGSELHVSSDFGTGFVGLAGRGELNIEDSAKLSFSGINTDLNVASDLDDPSTGSGTMNVRTGGRIEGLTFLDIGGQPGGLGEVNVDGPGSVITLSGKCPPSNCPPSFSFPDQGAFLTVGANRGTGALTLTNGGSILIDTSATPGAEFAGFNLGANSILGPEGQGTLTVDGAGSELRVRGNKGFFSVGRLEDGTGVLNVVNGGRVIMENGDSRAVGFVADRSGASGTILIDGASSLVDAGQYFGIGVDTASPSIPGGDGVVTLRNGGKLKADTIGLNNGARLVGNGIVEADTYLNYGGTIDVGESTGKIKIVGNLFMAAGSHLELEIDSILDFDTIEVTQDIVIDGGLIDLILGFNPAPTDVIDINALLVDADGILSGSALGNPELFNVIANRGSGIASGTLVEFALNGETFRQEVTTVPVPGTAPLFAAGALALIGFLRVVQRRTRPLTVQRGKLG